MPLLNNLRTRLTVDLSHAGDIEEVAVVEMDLLISWLTSHPGAKWIRVQEVEDLPRRKHSSGRREADR